MRAFTAHGGPAKGTIEIHQVHPALRLDDASLRRLVRCVLEGEGRRVHFLNIILTDHASVRGLHGRWLGVDEFTDVISFSLGDGEDIDGEIYVDLDTAMERHTHFFSTFEDETRRYIIHGLLHLIGYDDADPQRREAMRRKEDYYLTTWESGSVA